jgi:ribosomal protein S18 acetylase RimI-like enzyme
MELRIACEADAEAIAALVNRAYRPSPKDMGWTHEANLISGDRTTAEQVMSLLSERSVILLLCIDQKIAACVHVQRDQSNAYIGMLATDPALQTKGLGKEIISHAEKYALENFQVSAFKMSILSSRPELLAFYERRGYGLTGEIEAYPLSAGVGQPIVEGIHVLSLLKRPV